MGHLTQLTSITPPASCYDWAARVLHFSAGVDCGCMRMVFASKVILGRHSCYFVPNNYSLTSALSLILDALIS